jgi:glycosyltransferase involved in cell wall biosynthesis
MSIVVYTKGVAVEGGGGRRVASELLHHFNTISGRAVSWSVLPLRPEILYGGRYVYEARHVLPDFESDPDFSDPDFCRRCAEAFVAMLEEERPDFLLFDTEYSLREFGGWSDGLVDPDLMPPTAVLVHDQLWKWNPAILPLGSGAGTAGGLARECPLPELADYVIRVRRSLRAALAEDQLSGNGILERACAVEPEPVEPAPIDQTEIDRLLGIKRLVNGVDRVFCLTGRSRDEAVAAYNLAPENGFQASPLCFDYDYPPSPDVRARLGLGSGKGILAFSRMSPEKNIELVLLAFSRFLAEEQGGDAELWLAGHCLPEFREYIDSIKDLSRRLGLDGRVRFIGTVSDEDMLGLYAEADAFLCAQVADFNLSVQTALQSGLPVVVFGGYDFPAEISASGGVFCDCRTIGDMAKGLCSALASSGPTARERGFLERHTFYNYAQTVVGSFLGLAHRDNPALEEPGPVPAGLRERCRAQFDERLARVVGFMDGGLYDEAMSELNVLECAGLREDVPDALFERLSAMRVEKKRRSLFPENLRPVTQEGPPLSSYRNRFEGKRAFIVGNGPSLGQLDLAPLEHEYVFGVNSLFLLFDELGFKPDFYVVEDTLVAEDNAEIINSLSGMQRFYGRYLQYCLDDAPEVTWLNVVFDYGEYHNFPHFGRDAAERLWVGGTVSYLNMQLAHYMGFDEVYMIGFDHSYVIPDSARREGTVITSAEDDPNHFHSDYFGRGKRWHDPFLDRMELAYRRGRQVMESNGVAVMNATRGGKLEIFPRVRYESLFADRSKAGKRS